MVYSERKRFTDKRWREQNRERYRENQKRWWQVHPNYMKKWRKKHREEEAQRQRENYQRDIVKCTARNRSRSAYYPRIGICSECGSNKNIEAHHLDYKNPMKYVLLCRICHRNKHPKKAK